MVCSVFDRSYIKGGISLSALLCSLSLSLSATLTSYCHTCTHICEEWWIRCRYTYIYTATPRSGNKPSYKLKGMNLSPWQCLSQEFRQLISYKCFVPEWFLSSSSTCCKYVSERQHAKFVAAKPLKIEMSWLRNSVLIGFFNREICVFLGIIWRIQLSPYYSIVLWK